MDAVPQDLPQVLAGPQTSPRLRSPSHLSLFSPSVCKLRCTLACVYSWYFRQRGEGGGGGGGGSGGLETAAFKTPRKRTGGGGGGTEREREREREQQQQQQWWWLGKGRVGLPDLRRVHEITALPMQAKRLLEDAMRSIGAGTAAPGFASSSLCSLLRNPAQECLQYQVVSVVLCHAGAAAPARPPVPQAPAAGTPPAPVGTTGLGGGLPGMDAMLQQMMSNPQVMQPFFGDTASNGLAQGLDTSLFKSRFAYVLS